MKNNRHISSFSFALFILLQACGGGSSTTENDNGIEPTDGVTGGNSETTPVTGEASVNDRDRQRTRSPQGISDDVESRRYNARTRNARTVFQLNEEDFREIRSYDGSSNNINNPDWGSNFSHLQRIGEANYTDGISSMAGDHRKSAREVSNLVVAQSEGESILNTYGTSDYVWVWGQFIDHDFGITDGSEDEPENILVPKGDVFFDPEATGQVVIPFNRAIYDPDTGTSVANVREQENEISSWIDGSMIYGSDDNRNAVLREGSNSPYLATSENNLLPFNTEGLTNANGFIAEPETLFLAGDVRANEQAGLAAMHTLWVREHNRLASVLERRNPEASPDAIYEQTRRLVIGMVQHITYNEFLPALIGENTMPAYSGYDENVNGNLFNEFSSAAFRLGHSAVNNTFLRVDADGNTIAKGDLALRDAFFTAHLLFTEENDIDPLLRGFSIQTHQRFDNQVVNNLRNFLFGMPGAGGFDLVSLNIQRGRDHGLPTYNDVRVAMGLEPVEYFSDITDNTNLQMQLFNAYESVENIDLWVGGLSENCLLYTSPSPRD